MLILGLETSCDETSAALVQDGTKILSLVTATSQAMHQKYGGIIPDRAAREQLKSILPVIQEALSIPSEIDGAHFNPSSIDAIAVTVGPGLIGSLLVGVETAKSLALAWSKPLIPVNHLIGHIYATWLTETELPTFPALVLLVSGGHTELILMTGHGQFRLLGSTLDDAAGECFDKCGRLLGLPYPYGPYIEKEAAMFSNGSSEVQIKLPRPLINAKNYDFSFSGLKTAFLNEFHRLQTTNHGLPGSNSKAALAYELQEAVTDILVSKFLRAAEVYRPKSLILAGGVAANSRLREKTKWQITNSRLKTSLYIPPLHLCTDNAAYIASAAFFNNHPIPPEATSSIPGLTISDPLF